MRLQIYNAFARIFLTGLCILLLTQCATQPTGPGDVAGSGSEAGNTSGLTGKACYPGGAAAVGAKVILHVKQTPAGLAKRAATSSATTDSLGMFFIKNVPAGEYYIEISDTLRNGVLIRCVMPQNDTLIKLPADTLKPIGAIRGKLMLADSASLSFAWFYAVTWETGTLAYADTSGHFILNNIPQGSYTLRINSYSHDYAVIDFLNVVVTPDDTTDLGSIPLRKIDSTTSGSGYVQDTLAVRAILDSNGIALPVKDVTWVLNGRVVYLQINGNLTVLPDAIGDLTQLQYLGLFGTSLYNQAPLQISSGIRNLKALSVLIINGEKLESFPQEMAGLQSLETVNLYNNALNAIPSWIFGLKNLKVLNLSSNKISSLANEISNLKSLTTLDLSDNTLPSLPAGIDSLTLLESFLISSNQLTGLPQGMENLSSLTEFSISHNQISTLPEDIISLSCAIDVAYNGLCNISLSLENWLDNHYCYYLNCGSSTSLISWKNTQTCP
ncbi:MAG: leucine-rich repeat domain-containing protein [Fibrobacterota bacterium]